MKGYLSLSYIIAFAVLIITLTFVIFAYISHFEQDLSSYEISSKKLGEMYILNKIITSKNCISTGETGTLNQSLIIAANGGGELDYAYLPDFGHYVKVDDLTNGNGWDWTFGYRRNMVIGNYKIFEIPVSIVDGDVVKPGKISVGVISSKDDILLLVAGAAERAWVKGSYTTTFTPTIKDQGMVSIASDRICDSDGDCKYLLNAVMDPTTLTIGSSYFCELTFEKVAGPKIETYIQGCT